MAEMSIAEFLASKGLKLGNTPRRPAPEGVKIGSVVKLSHLCDRFEGGVYTVRAISPNRCELEVSRGQDRMEGIRACGAHLIEEVIYL